MLLTASELAPPTAIAALVAALTTDPGWTDAGKLAGESFDRFARLAEQLSPGFWEDAAANSGALARWLDATAERLLAFSGQLRSGETARLESEWKASRQALDRWRKHSDDPRFGQAQRAAARVVVRSCEGMLVALDG